MNWLYHLPPWLCGIIIVSTIVVLSLAGLPLFHSLIGRRLRLTEETNNSVIFFATAIDIF